MTGQISGPFREPRHRKTRECRCGREHKRTFHVYLDGPWWRWCCTMCEPPARGARWHHYYGGVHNCLQVVLKVSMKYHMRVREQHHDYVIANLKASS